MTNTRVKCKEAHSFTVTKFFSVGLYSENVRRPLKEWFVPKYISAESVSESESESKKNFVDPIPNPKKKFSDPQH
jgi:hypothetical protein